MRDGGLSRLSIERTGFKHNVRARFFNPLANIAASMERSGRPVSIQDGKRSEAIGVGNPAGSAGGHTSETPAHIIAAAQLGFLGHEQAQEFLADVAKANNCEVIRRNGPSLSESVCRGSCQFCG